MKRSLFRLAAILGAQIALGAPLGADSRSGQRVTEQVALRQRPLVSVVDGRLSVSLKETPLPLVLESLARESGVRIFLHGSAEATVTDEFQSAPLEEGLRRLLQGRSTAYFYSERFNGAEQRAIPKLSEVRIFAHSPGDSRDVKAFAFAETGRDKQRTRPAVAGAGKAEIGSIASLVEQLERGEDIQSRKHAAARLGKSWSEEAVAPLAGSLAQDPSAAVREAAARALGESWSENAVAPLLGALQFDSDGRVREQAARALAQTAGEEAVDALIQSLESDPRWYVRDAAAWALGALGSRQAQVALLHYSQTDRDSWVRESATLSAMDLAD